MRRAALAIVTLAFAGTTYYGGALGHGWQPVALGGIPMAEPGLASGDWTDYCAAWRASTDLRYLFGAPLQCN